MPFMTISFLCLINGWIRLVIMYLCSLPYVVNTLRPRQNGRRFADDTFKRIFLNENDRISIKISLKFVAKGPINNNPTLVQIMAWRRSGDKPLSEPMMVSLLTHLCVNQPQWVNIDSSVLMNIKNLKKCEGKERLLTGNSMYVQNINHIYIYICIYENTKPL